MPLFRVTITLLATEEGMAWEHERPDAAAAKAAAIEYFVEMLDGLTEPTDYVVRVDEMG